MQGCDCGSARARPLLGACPHRLTEIRSAAAMHKDIGLAHRLTDVALALHAIE